MAISAVFTANFDKLEQAVQKAEVRIKSFESGAKNAARDVSRLAESFSGAKIQTEAAKVVRAVESIGGVSKLTQTEINRVGATVTEAIEKFSKMGQAVPKNIQAVADQLKGLDQDGSGGLKKIVGGFNELGSAAGPVGTAVAGVTQKVSGLGATAAAIGPVGIAIAAVGVAAVGLGVAVVTAADKLVDITRKAADLGDKMKVLSQQTGLSTEFLTKMRFVADQTDAPLEAITSAVFKMSQGVAEGGKKVKAGLDAIGLSIADVRKMSPETAFETVVAGLGKIPDAGTRAAAGVAIFGKQFKEISQLTQEDIAALGERAAELGVVFGDDFAEAGDRLNDAISEIRTRFEGLELQLGKELLPVAIAVTEGIVEAFDEAFASVGISTEDVALVIERVAVAIVQTTARIVAVIARVADVIAQFVAGEFISDFGLIEIFSDITDKYLQMVKVFERITPGDRRKEIAELEALNKKIGDFARNASQRTAEVAAGFNKSAKAVQDMADKFSRDLPASVERTRRSLQDSAAATDKNRDAVNKLIGSIDGLGGSSDKQKDKIKGLTDGLTDAVDKAAKFARDIEKLGGITKLSADQQEAANKVLLAGVDAMEALGRTGDPLYEKLVRLATATTNWNGTLGPLKLGIDSVLGSLRNVDNTFLNSVLFGSGGQLGPVKLGIPSGLGIQVETDIEKIDKALKKSSDSTKDWDEKLRTLTQSFADLATISGGSLDGALADFADLIALMDQGAQFGGMLRDVFYNPKKVTGRVDEQGNPVLGGFDFSNLTGANGAEATVGAYTQLAGIALAAADGSTPVLRATNVRGRGNRALRGAAAGMAEGGQFGPWGALGGAAAGAIIGAARNPMFEDLMNRTAHDFGVEVSEELARGMEDIAKSKFGKDRAAALTFSLPSIIAEGGGVKEENIDKLTARLRDVFVMVGTGKFTMRDATDTLDKSFGFFAEHILKSKDLASKSFQEIIALNEQFGTQSEQIRAFVEGQTAVLGESISALAGPLVEQSGLLQQQIDETMEAMQRFGEDDNITAYEESSAKLTGLLAQQKDLASSSAEEFERLGVITLGAFNASIAAGTDYVTAVDKIGPAIDQLITLQEDLGLTSQNAALIELQSFRERVNNNRTLVTSTKALGETMRALASIGGLNTETLAAMEQQGVVTFERLKAAGFNENQALLQMKDFLLNVIQAHAELGTPIDENTQKLIDQAREMGLLKGGAKDTTQIMQEGFAKVTGAVGLLAKTLGADVPDAIQDAIDALSDVPSAVDDITNAIDRIPRDIDINATVNYDDQPPDLSRPHEGFAGGSGGLRNFGTGTPAVLHGWEAVLTADEYHSMMRDVEGVPVMAGGGTTVQVSIDARGALVGDFASQQRFSRMIQDALQNDAELRRQFGVTGYR